MASEWSKIALSEVTESLNTGLDAITRAPIVQYHTGIKCLRIQDISNNKPFRLWGNTHVRDADYERYRLRRGEIIIARTCSTGINFLVKEDIEAVFNNGLARLRLDKSRAFPEYIYYVFKSTDFINYISGISGGTSVQLNMKVGDLAKFEFSLPPLPEQRAIASLLGALDDKIELNRQMNETLEATARLFFKDWFVDFGPTRTKAEGRPPYLAPELWSLFPDALDDDDKPVGWASGSISDLARLNPESWTTQTLPNEIEYVDLSNTKWGQIEQTQIFTRSQAPSRAQRVLRPGDTIVGTVRPGNGSYALVSLDGLTGSTGFAVLRPTRPEHREIVYLTATSRETIDALTHLADGAAYPAIRPDVVAAQSVVIPDGRCLTAFSQHIAAIIDQIEVNKVENNTLAQLRDMLLPKLMSGEIRIREMEKVIGEAL